MAAAMRETTHAIYPMLVACNVHPFIEFCGLMSKYVDLCREAAQKGVQFPFASEHSGMPLPAEDHDMEYLAEKLRCIFGPTLDANPSVRSNFLRALVGDQGVLAAASSISSES